MNYEPVLNFAGSLASLISLVLAFVFARKAKKHSEQQIRLAKEHSEQASRLVSKAQKIADSLSTRFVGDFPNPKYYQEVASLIEGPSIASESWPRSRLMASTAIPILILG